LQLLKTSAVILFFIFSFILFAGTNNIVILLAKFIPTSDCKLVTNKLKTSLNSLMEEEKSEHDEDDSNSKVIDLYCEQTQQHIIPFTMASAEYIASNNLIMSIYKLPIFNPPPNI
jgi:hypothetical protein